MCLGQKHYHAGEERGLCRRMRDSTASVLLLCSSLCPAWPPHVLPLVPAGGMGPRLPPSAGVCLGACRQAGLPGAACQAGLLRGKVAVCSPSSERRQGGCKTCADTHYAPLFGAAVLLLNGDVVLVRPGCSAWAGLTGLLVIRSLLCFRYSTKVQPLTSNSSTQCSDGPICTHATVPCLLPPLGCGKPVGWHGLGPVHVAPGHHLQPLSCQGGSCSLRHCCTLSVSLFSGSSAGNTNTDVDWLNVRKGVLLMSHNGKHDSKGVGCVGCTALRKLGRDGDAR